MSDEKTTWVPVIAKITNRETGETREYKTELLTTDDYDGTWQWDEGNYGCDCNRRLFFERANGVELDLCSTPCGEEFFSVELVKDGVVIYSD